MKILICFLLFIISTQAKASVFECVTFLNLDPIAAQIVHVDVGNKIAVDTTEVAHSFITQKQIDVYVLELYLPLTDVRIYSEASVTMVDQTITSSIWARDYMVDVVCRLIEK